MSAWHILELLSTGQTQRYHTEALTKPQDVAQHTYNMLWIAWKLAGEKPSAGLLMGVLSHDAGERYTGDMPGPVKHHICADAALDALEAKRLKERCDVSLDLNLTPVEKEIIRLADRVEGMVYCFREWRRGNQEIKPALRNYIDYVRELHHPRWVASLVLYIMENSDYEHP